MIIPNFEYTKLVDENGYLTPQWQSIFQQLITALQTNLSDEGFLPPQQPTTNIATLQTRFNASSAPSNYFGDLIYDSTTDELKVNIAGTFKVVQVV